MHDNETTTTAMPNPTPKEDSWAFQSIGSPFPDNLVKVIGQQDIYVALWYKNGKPIHGYAWNDNDGGVVQASFPWNMKEMTGEKEVSGLIQLLQCKGDFKTLGYWYEWIPYKDRFEKADERQLVRCGDSAPILWEGRPGGSLLGNLDLRTEEAMFAKNGKVELLIGGSLDGMKVLFRNLKGGPGQSQQKQESGQAKGQSQQYQSGHEQPPEMPRTREETEAHWNPDPRRRTRFLVIGGTCDEPSLYEVPIKQIQQSGSGHEQPPATSRVTNTVRLAAPPDSASTPARTNRSVSSETTLRLGSLVQIGEGRVARIVGGDRENPSLIEVRGQSRSGHEQPPATPRKVTSTVQIAAPSAPARGERPYYNRPTFTSCCSDCTLVVGRHGRCPHCGQQRR